MKTSTTYYTIKDYLGNIRKVMKSDRTIVQAQNYYPFGSLLNDNGNSNNIQTHKYNGKELDRMHGLDLYDYGARHYDATIGQFTTMDPLCEKYYHISPYAYCLGNPVVFFDPNGEEPTPAEAARMAAHVYGNMDNAILTGGWQVSNRDFGINLIDNYGLLSKVYEKVDNGVVTEYAYVIAGTDELCDWLDNFEQPLGLSTQYHNAAENAKTLSRILKNTELTYIGHSLGGGEAALSSLLTYGEGKGRKAFTFNAAGVSNITKIVEGTMLTPFRFESNIYAFIMKTDPLNNAQNVLKIMPNVNGIRLYLSPQDLLSIFDGHSIESVLKSLGVSNPEKYKLR